MRKSILVSILSSAAVLLSCTSATFAVTLYGTAYIGSQGPASLYVIDSVTGTETLVGLTGYNQVSAIDFDPLSATPTLYGVGYNISAGRFDLITIDITTGVGTTVGAVGSNIGPFHDISFHSDGTLFGVSITSVFTFNLATGAATPLVPGTTGLGKNGSALAHDLSNTLFTINSDVIATINQTTGAGTPTGITVDYPLQLGTDPRANAMDYDLPANVLYASVVHGGEGTPVNFIAQINLATGEVTGIHSTIPGMDGLAVLPTIGNHFAVPDSMSTLWLALPVCGLLLLARYRHA